MPNAIVILAAGKGSRMKSDLPKVLHEIAGAPLLVHAMGAASSVDVERTVIVAGHGADLVQAAAQDHDPECTVVLQQEQKGTAHAVDQARETLADFDGDVFVLYADTPFVEPETLLAMAQKRAEGADLVVLGFEAEVPGGYGRLVLAKDGSLDAIVEAKDATPEQLAVTLCNSGVMCASRKTIFELLSKVGNDNAQGEYYLTDIVHLAKESGLSAATVTCPEAETLGVNSRADLANAEAIYQNTQRALAMENGITLVDPNTVWFGYDTVIGRDVLVEQNVVFGPDVTIESGAYIRAFSHLEGCHVAQGATVGPYARLRPGAEIGEGGRIGNFVEVKNAILGEGAKVNHLSYIGDAEIGKDANIGAGTITCNYDGVFKHKTVIGERAFIGSNASLVAPVTIGDDALTGSGSVITSDVPAGDLALGRGRQENKKGLGKRLMDKLRTQKAAKKKD